MLIADNHSIRDLCWLRYTAKLIVNLVLETWVIDEEGKIVFFSLSLSIQLEFNIMTYSISIKFLCHSCMKVIQIFWYIIVCIDHFSTFTYKNMSSERKNCWNEYICIHLTPSLKSGGLPSSSLAIWFLERSFENISPLLLELWCLLPRLRLQPLQSSCLNSLFYFSHRHHSAWCDVTKS